MATLVANLVGIMVAIIIGVSVTMVVVDDVVTEANFSGTEATVVGLFVVLIAVGLMLSIVNALF